MSSNGWPTEPGIIPNAVVYRGAGVGVSVAPSASPAEVALVSQPQRPCLTIISLCMVPKVEMHMQMSFPGLPLTQVLCGFIITWSADASLFGNHCKNRFAFCSRT